MATLKKHWEGIRVDDFQQGTGQIGRKRTRDTDPISTRTQTYDLDERTAHLLYAILKIQHDDLAANRLSDNPEDLPGATQQRLSEVTGYPLAFVTTTIHKLERAGYVMSANIKTGFTSPNRARKIYELNAESCVTCQDTARFLIYLLRAEKDYEGKLDFKQTLNGLLESNHFGYLGADDFYGATDGKGPAYWGKLAELAATRKHIERVGRYLIRPRLMLYLERRYLELVADQIDLETLRKRLTPPNESHRPTA